MTKIHKCNLFISPDRPHNSSNCKSKSIRKSTPEICTSAVCVLRGKKTRFKGHVYFHQCHKNNFVNVKMIFSGLKPNKTYAIHIHEFGDLRHGCESLGGHWNPDHTTHGSFLYPNQCRHAGDLINNIQTNKYGKFECVYKDPMFTLTNPSSVIGRSVVLHGHADDLGQGKTKESKINGCAGKKIMCGVIGYCKND